MRLTPALAASATLLLATGCHSKYVETTLSNRTAEVITLVEVDYPSASFGTQTLTPGQDFHYRFKVLGSGPLKLLWTDAAHHDHTEVGPSVDEGSEGTLTITIQPTGVDWQPHLKH